MVYLNNAATTYPKPESVIKALADAIQTPPSNPFRSTEGNGCFLDELRKLLGILFGISDTGRIYFSAGATDSLNRILGGMELYGLPVVTTVTEHNSVLRPLFNNPLLSCNISFVSCGDSGEIKPDEVDDILCRVSENVIDRPFSGLFIINHCSNVTGFIQDVKSIGKIVHDHGFVFMLDISQSAGCIPIKADEWGVDILAFTGHKSLFGPQGTGGYYVRRGLNFRPVQFGGTGRDSSQLVYTDDYEFEVGTQNIFGLTGLKAGVEYVLGRGLDNIMSTESKKIKWLRNRLNEISGIILYGKKELEYGPLLSFNVRGLSSSDVGYILQNSYDITVRTGLHCSPLIHKALQSEKYGTVRVSISDMTKDEDMEKFVSSITDIAGSVD